MGMEFIWSGRNKVPEECEPRYEGSQCAGIIDSSKVLKYHNAYMIHNETLYCNEKEEWRGDYSCLKVRLHFTRDKGFYYKNEEPKYQQVPNQSTEPSRTDEDEEDEGDVPRNGRYTLKSVKKIDHYSRRIFAGTYITFALYFFIRYHAIEGALSIDFVE